MQHLLAILQDLKACSGRQRFKTIGLDLELLLQLEVQTLRFASLSEHLLLECSQARSFARTLFQLLLFQAQKLTESAEGTPSTRPDNRGATASVALGTKNEDVDCFVAAMRGRRSLELEEVSQRIGKPQAKPEAKPEATSEESLVAQLAMLATTAEGLGQRLCTTMARQSCKLAERHLELAPPWRSLRPELAWSDVPSPRGLGRPVVHMVWEDRVRQEELAETLREGLRLVWCDGTDMGAQLVLARLHLEVGRCGTAIQPELEMAKLSANTSGSGHLLLCRSYDAARVAVLLQDGKLMTTQVCLIDLSAIPFRKELPVPLTLWTELPQDAVRQSEPLPESYWWASSMRVMSQRGVCSVYSSRARRLLTLDMEADEDDMEDDP